MLTISSLLLLGLQAASAPLPADPAAINAVSTPALAARLLPRSLASQVVSHRADYVRSGSGQSGREWGIQFFTAAQPSAPGVCHRQSYRVNSDARGQLRTNRRYQVISNDQIALADQCNGLADSRFAYVQAGVPLRSAQTALLQLQAFQQLAQRGSRTGFSIRCTSYDQSHCDGGSVQQFSALPLDRIFLIEPARGGGGRMDGWSFAVMPNGPGQDYFDVRMSRPGMSIQPMVHLRWERSQ